MPKKPWAFSKFWLFLSLHYLKEIVTACDWGGGGEGGRRGERTSKLGWGYSLCAVETQGLCNSWAPLGVTCPPPHPATPPPPQEKKEKWTGTSNLQVPLGVIQNLNSNQRNTFYDIFLCYFLTIKTPWCLDWGDGSQGWSACFICRNSCFTSWQFLKCITGISPWAPQSVAWKLKENLFLKWLILSF